MAKKIRLSQEEEVIRFLKKEGFRELNPEEVEKEPYKSIYELPECFTSPDKSGKKKVKNNHP